MGGSTQSQIPGNTISVPKKEDDGAGWPGRDKSKIQQVSQQTFTYTIFHAGCKRKRCGSCKGCNSDDCGTCLYCQDKPKFGGPGKKKQCCEKRKCLEMQNNKVMKLLCKIQLASLIYFHQVILPSPETSSSTLSSRSALPPAATPLKDISNCVQNIKVKADHTSKARQEHMFGVEFTTVYT